MRWTRGSHKGCCRWWQLLCIRALEPHVAGSWIFSTVFRDFFSLFHYNFYPVRTSADLHLYSRWPNDPIWCAIPKSSLSCDPSLYAHICSDSLFPGCGAWSGAIHSLGSAQGPSRNSLFILSSAFQRNKHHHLGVPLLGNGCSGCRGDYALPLPEKTQWEKSFGFSLVGVRELFQLKCGFSI